MSVQGYKETLTRDIQENFEEGDGASYGEDQIAEFAASALEEGYLTHQDISEAIIQGLLNTTKNRKSLI